MNKTILLTGLVLALGSLGACLPEKSALSVTDAYAFATTEAQKNGAVFLTAQNNSGEAITITAASAANAETLELHTMSMENNVMQMRKVESFAIEAGQNTTLKPMGDHIMLMGLKAPLKEGESFPLTLTTSAGEVTVDVKIVAPGTTHGTAH
jgi:copper(I)-binding protein